mmetsp:Transcript_50728/g.162393  ORF Transcript_50728/g.162393 Transcript_50728/m.162393 type:complete len:215 (+) Transcript_50728:287-931(+)
MAADLPRRAYPPQQPLRPQPSPPPRQAWPSPPLLEPPLSGSPFSALRTALSSCRSVRRRNGLLFQRGRRLRNSSRRLHIYEKRSNILGTIEEGCQDIIGPLYSNEVLPYLCIHTERLARLARQPFNPRVGRPHPAGAFATGRSTRLLRWLQIRGDTPSNAYLPSLAAPPGGVLPTLGSIFLSGAARRGLRFVPSFPQVCVSMRRTAGRKEDEVA